MFKIYLYQFGVITFVFCSEEVVPRCSVEGVLKNLANFIQKNL